MTLAITAVACSSQEQPGGGGGGGRVSITSDGGLDRAAVTPSGASSLPSGCAALKPSSALIADFSDANDLAFGVYGVNSVFGQTFADRYLIEDFSALSWHITGLVHTAGARFGLEWFCSSGTGPTTGDCVLDVSAYAGIQFTIRGDAGPDHAVDLQLGQPADEAVITNPGCGACFPSDACVNPQVTIDLGSGSSPMTVTLLWSNIAGGAPRAVLDGQLLSSFAWHLHDSPADSNVPVGGDPSVGVGAYAVDLTIDDIRFIPLGAR